MILFRILLRTPDLPLTPNIECRLVSAVLTVEARAPPPTLSLKHVLKRASSANT